MKFLKHVILGSMLSGSVAFAADTTKKATNTKAPAAEAAGKATTATKTLFERLGGKPAIEAVVGEFLTNVAADTRINGFFKNTDTKQLGVKLTNQICEATGGDCKYTGMDMKTAHTAANLKRASGGAHEKIGDAEFNALVEDLTKALDKFKVPAQEKSELIAALGGMKNDIVSAPKKQM